MGTGRLVLVDESGEPLGEADEQACHAGRGLLHLAFTILLIDGQGNFIIQRRSAFKRLWPRYWEATCSGHPRVNQNLLEAVICRLKEEMGISALVVSTGRFLYRAEYGSEGVEWEVCHLMVGTGSSSDIRPDPREVEDYRILKPAELFSEMRYRPQDFAPWLFPAAELWRKEQKWNG